MTQKPTVAVLLSALVFPGAVHVYLKQFVFGFGLIAVAIASLYVLISHAIKQALSIVEKIQSGEVAPDISVITTMVSEQISGADAQLVNLATIALIVVWVIGIVGSYLAGRK